MSQSMSLTKFTTHLDEGHSRRRCWWPHIISAPQTFRQLFVSVGVVSSTQGTWHNKGQKRSALVQLDEILTLPPLLLPVSPVLWQNACSTCQTRVPGLPGQKGEKGWPGEQGAQGILGEKVLQMERTTQCGTVSWSIIINRNNTLNYVPFVIQTGRSRGQGSDGKPWKGRPKGRHP